MHIHVTKTTLLMVLSSHRAVAAPGKPWLQRSEPAFPRRQQLLQALQDSAQHAAFTHELSSPRRCLHKLQISANYLFYKTMSKRNPPWRCQYSKSALIPLLCNAYTLLRCSTIVTSVLTTIVYHQKIDFNNYMEVQCTCCSVRKKLNGAAQANQSRKVARDIHCAKLRISLYFLKSLMQQVSATRLTNVCYSTWETIYSDTIIISGILNVSLQ